MSELGLPKTDEFMYSPVVLEGAAVLREIGMDEAADRFMWLDYIAEDRARQLRNYEEDNR